MSSSLPQVAAAVRRVLADADVLFLSVRTVKIHVGHILAKLGLESRAAVVVSAHRQGLA